MVVPKAMVIYLCVHASCHVDSSHNSPRDVFFKDPLSLFAAGRNRGAMAGPWQWGGAGWWSREHWPSGWVEWVRIGGFTPGEGGHRARVPRDEGCFLSLDLTFTANWLCRLAACPHEAFLSLQQQLVNDLGVTLRISCTYIHSATAGSRQQGSAGAAAEAAARRM